MRFFYFLILLFACHTLKGQTVNFTANENEGCVPLIASYSTQNIANATYIYWDFGNGTYLSGNPATNPILFNPTIAYIDNGIYTVVLTYTIDGITESVTRNNYIKAYSIPSVNFNADNYLGCGNFSIQFTDESTVDYGEISEWNWDFGNGFESFEQNPSSSYSTEGSYDVSLQITSNYGCEATLVQNDYITAIEGPYTQFEVNSNYACDLPFELEVTNTSFSTNPISYVWDFDNGQSSTEQQPGSMVYTDYGNYSITLTGIDTSTCSVEFTQSLLIQPMHVDFDVNYGCAPTWITFYNTSSLGLTDFSWNYGDPGSGIANTDSTYHAIHFYSSANTYPVTLIGENDGGCFDSLTVNIQVDEAPFEIDLSEDFICELPTYTNINVPTPGISAIQWQLIDSIGETVFSGDTTDFTFFFDSSFETFEEDYYHLSLSIDYDDGCHKEVFLEDFITIVIPYLDGNIVDINGCYPHEVTFIDSSSFPYGFTEIQWNLGNGEFEYGSEVSYSYSDTGNYYVNLTLTTPQGCQIDTMFENPVGIGLNVPPSFSYVEDTICHADYFYLPYYGPYYVDSLHWINSGAIYAIPGSIDTMALSAINICDTIEVALRSYHNGCMSSSSLLLDNLVREGPQAQISQNPSFICYEDGPLVLDLQNSTCSVTENDSISYSWTIFLDDTTFTTSDATPPIFEINDPGIYEIILVASSSLTTCESFDNKRIIVDKLDLDLVYKDTIGCNPFQVIESAYSTSVSGLKPSFTWSFFLQDTTIIYETEMYELVTPLISDTGDFSASVLVTNFMGCKDSINYTIRSMPLPIAHFIPPDSIACSPSTVLLLDSSYGENPIYEWEWSVFGWENDSSSIQNPYFDLNYPTPYAVSLHVTDSYNCKSNPYVDLLYPPLIFPEFIIPDALCNGEEFQIINYSHGSNEPFTYFWDFGNGETSSEAEPIISYDSVEVSSYFYISIQISDTQGCSFTFTDSVLVSVPIFDIATSMDSTLTCPPVFTDIIPIGGGDIFSWEIDYGDGDTNYIYMDSTITSYSHVYEFPGYYDITIKGTDTNQCSISQQYDSLILIAGPFAEFTYSPTNGCPPLEVDFTINNESGVYDFIWVFGDGNIDSIYDPSHVYLNAGVFYPVLIIQDSVNVAAGDTLPCVVAIIGEELIIDGPIVDFTVSEDTLCFGGGPVTFTNQTIPVSGYDITGWLWDFGDGSTSTLENPPDHVYSEPGTYFVSLQANTDIDCVYYIEKFAVLVMDIPQLSPYAEYEVDCPSMPVQFYSDSTYWNDYISDVEWDFGDGSNDDEWSPLHFYENYGSFIVTVDYTIFSCLYSYVLNDSIYTHPQPSAQYTNYPLQNEDGIYGQLFENNSLGAISVNWFLDTVFQSSEDEIEVDFDSNPLILSLTAINEFGCTDTTIIELWEYYDDTTPNVFTPNGDGVNDYFSIDLSDVKDCVGIRIYNRWGQLIFEDSSYLNTWGGTNLKGEQVSDGTYFYIADICGKTTLKGYVTIIR